MAAIRELDGAEWQALSSTDALQLLNSDGQRGLSRAEAKRRLNLYGSNELPRLARASALRLFAAQFTDLLVLLLLAAIVVSLALQEWLDAGAIGAILVLNAALGFVQEYRAERALEALERLAAPLATVIRDGEPLVIEGKQLIPGDLIQLNAGDIVPADGRLIASEFLQLQEASLTGESFPEEKQSDEPLPEAIPLGDRTNMVYATTQVTRGNGRAVVTATGGQTQAGHLALLVKSSRRRATPLQRRLGEAARWLIAAALSLSLLLFIIGLLRGQELGEMFLTAVAVAVAAVPEGLPAAVTIVLALGVQRMVRRHVIVRRLESVETLGTVTVVCTDKTGTLTENRLAVKELFVDGETIALEAGAPAAVLLAARDDGEGQALGRLLLIAELCNEADVTTRAPDLPVTDPIERALMDLAQRAGFSFETLGDSYRLQGHIPFDSDRKMMTAVYLSPRETALALTKGAPEVIAARSDKILWGGQELAVSEEDRSLIEQRTAEMSARGLRVIALAYRTLAVSEVVPEIENHLVFVGLVGLADPLRPEARQAVETCRRAGIRVLMLTGDHAQTALAVGRELALVTGANARTLSGSEIGKMSEHELRQALSETAIYARITGEHKLQIVRALHDLGEIVAMTGDGVNDAPALKEADIGVAMGQAGTDVAKEASDMVLTDDNFASVVAAVEEGRTIYSNVRRFVYFLLSCNLGEISVMLAVALAAGETALLPVQILWVNLVTDGFPALALGLEPAKAERMLEKPRAPGSRLLDFDAAALLLLQAALVATPTLVAFAYGAASDGVKEGRELAFMTLVVAHLFAALNYRSISVPFFRMNIFSNPQLLAALAAAFALQLAPFYLPPLNDVFDVSPLNLWEWALLLPLASVSFLGIEAFKVLRQQKTSTSDCEPTGREIE
jgi:Ca2+-transporting ATPase